MLEILGISILLVGLIALLINYARSTRDVLKDVGIVNPLTVSIAVIVLIGLILELLKQTPDPIHDPQRLSSTVRVFHP
jgi:hypothetical protein